GGRDATGRPVVAAVEQHHARRAGQGARTARASLRSVRRRLQRVCADAGRWRTGDGLAGTVPPRAVAAEGEPGEERGGATLGAQVPRVHGQPREAPEVEGGPAVSETAAGEASADLSCGSREAP